MPITDRAPLAGLVPGDPARMNYLINWSPRHRYIYFEVPKTGCTTVKRMLQLAEVDGRAEKLDQNVHDKNASPVWSPADDLEAFEEALTSDAFLKFAFVRNPYARVLSAYLDKIVINEWERERRRPALGFTVDEEVPFLAFLQRLATNDLLDSDIHWTPQTSLLGIPQVRLDYIGRFEHFGEDLAAVAARLGLVEYFNEVRSERPHATGASDRLGEYLDPASQALAEQLYHRDFELLGYGRGIGIV